MLLFISVVAGLVVGVSLKGKLIRLAALRCLWIPIITLASGTAVRIIPDISFWLKAGVITFSYICIFVFIIANRKYVAPSITLSLGSLSNFIVIAVNGFRMPVSVRALSLYSHITAKAVATQRADYFVATDGAELIFLGDMVHIPIPVLEGFISVGDILISIGMFLLIIFAMTDKSIIISEAKQTEG
jgi:hypothetical protein